METNIVELKKHYKQDKKMRGLLNTAFASKMPSKNFSISRMAEKLSRERGISYAQAYELSKEFFRKLEALKVGKYVVGRRGYTSRFKSEMDLKDIAKLVKEEDVATSENFKEKVDIEKKALEGWTEDELAFELARRREIKTKAAEKVVDLERQIAELKKTLS